MGVTVIFAMRIAPTTPSPMAASAMVPAILIIAQIESLIWRVMAAVLTSSRMSPW